MQINRLFEIVYLLLNRESITAGELATQFEVSTRTIYRDVELLSSSGIPIYMTKGKGGGISLLPNFVLNKAVLTDGEKSDILSALHTLEAVSLEQVGTAVHKLSSLFGTQHADWVEIDFSEWANGEEAATLFRSLKTAVIEKYRVKFFYHGSDGATRRMVEPLKLCFKGQSWYLYAYCMLRDDYRFFKLRRIRELEVLASDGHFERIMPTKIFQEEVFQDDFVTITLKISKEMAYRVYDEFPAYEKLSNGDFMVQTRIPKGYWIYHYIATFGEHCELIEPAEIRQQVKQGLKKTLDLYII